MKVSLKRAARRPRELAGPAVRPRRRRAASWPRSWACSSAKAVSCAARRMGRDSDRRSTSCGLCSKTASSRRSTILRLSRNRSSPLRLLIGDVSQRTTLRTHRQVMTLQRWDWSAGYRLFWSHLRPFLVPPPLVVTGVSSSTSLQDVGWPPEGAAQ